MSDTPPLSSHYVYLIAELDKQLSMVRGYWIESRDEYETRRNLKRIDELLDERLRLMRARDAAKQIPST